MDREGKRVHLKGVALGGWLNMEHFILGYPGTETAFRNAVKCVLGEDKASFFFERLLENFITEDDIEFIAGLGCNVVRVALNYRLFEDDGNPFFFKEEGFRHLDRVIEYARRHGVYVIIDLHAVQGWQNPDWHCDNPYQATLIWSHSQYRERFYSLWRCIARRYRDEEAVAGYDVMNEPVTGDPKALNEVYNGVLKAIRSVDTEHIVFLKGNLWGTSFEEIDHPDDENIVYSVHHYVLPGLVDAPYPTKLEGKIFDKHVLEEEYVKKTMVPRKRGTPIYVGEFGSIFYGTGNDMYRVAVDEDLMSIFNKYGDHWTRWTYKDIGVMGLVYLSGDTPWMKFTERVRRIKRILGTDEWGPGSREGFRSKLTRSILEELKNTLRNEGVEYRDISIDYEGRRPPEKLKEAYSFSRNLKKALSNLLALYTLHLLAEQFSRLDYKELEKLAESFHLSNCIVRKKLAEAFKKYCK